MNINPNEVLIRVGGAGLSQSDQRRIWDAFIAILEMRVGTRLTSQMSKGTLDALSRFESQATEGRAYQRALDEAVPDYRLIVQEELDLLVEEFLARYNSAMKGLKE